MSTPTICAVVIGILLIFVLTSVSVSKTANITYTPDKTPQPIIYLQKDTIIELSPDNKISFTIGDESNENDITAIEINLVDATKKYPLLIDASATLMNRAGSTTNVLWDVASQYTELPEGPAFLSLTLHDKNNRRAETKIPVIISKHLLRRSVIDDNIEKTAKQQAGHCICKRMTVKFTGNADNNLAVPAEVFGSPHPAAISMPTTVLGPSSGVVTTGPYKGRFRAGWIFQIKAEIEGDPHACTEQQFTKGTMTYYRKDGSTERITSHDIGRGKTNIFVPRGNAGYYSVLWAPDDYTKELKYCSLFKQSCNNDYYLKRKKQNLITWIDAPGAWLRNDFKKHLSDVKFNSIVHGTGDGGSCSCMLTMHTDVERTETDWKITRNTIRMTGGEKCQAEGQRREYQTV